jgi:hypothetical protein
VRNLGRSNTPGAIPLLLPTSLHFFSATAAPFMGFVSSSKNSSGFIGGPLFPFATT